MYPMATFLREKRLRWFGHVQRQDKDEVTRNILQMVVSESFFLFRLHIHDNVANN